MEAPTYEEEEYIEQYEPKPIVVSRNQDIDRVLRNATVGRNNIVNVVKEVLTRFGVNFIFVFESKGKDRLVDFMSF